MNEDFGVGRRPSSRPSNLQNGNNGQALPRPVSVNPQNYRPMAQIQPRPAQNPLTQGLGQTTQSTNSNQNKTASPDISVTLDDDTNNKKGKIPGQGKFDRFKHFLATRTKKQWIIFGAVALVVTAGSATGLAMLIRDDKPVKTATEQKQAAPKPVEKPKSPLTGLEVAEEDTKRPVIGIMIENSTLSRPQSGLKDAGVVYEAIAEYGITRFLALYQEANPGNIGPIRSARPYYVDWVRSYDASYAHVGGSPDALSKIKADGVRDIDQFYNSGSYHRINQREAPHNVYTSMTKLRELTASKGWTNSAFTSLSRKKDAPAKTVTANSIDIAISGPTYNVHYDYDAASNTYPRTMGGEAHNDADSGARVAPKVVIGIVTPYGLMPDGYHSTYATTGSGLVKIFQDGTVTEGTWERSNKDNYVFKDTTGKVISLNPGQTWITVVGAAGHITHTAPAPPATTTQ